MLAGNCRASVFARVVLPLPQRPSSASTSGFVGCCASAAARREIRPGGAMFCGMDACSFYKIEPSQSLLRNASSPEGESF
jgi:hypothetical protein